MKRSPAPAAADGAPGTKKTRFTAAVENRFAKDVEHVAERKAQELQEQGIRNIVIQPRANPSLIPGCQAFLASGGTSVKDEFPRSVGTPRIKSLEIHKACA